VTSSTLLPEAGEKTSFLTTSLAMLLLLLPRTASGVMGTVAWDSGGARWKTEEVTWSVEKYGESGLV
jgi:hypothetical protein